MITGFVDTHKRDNNSSFRDVYALIIPDNLKNEYYDNGLFCNESSKDQEYVNWWKKLIEHINNLETVDISSCDWNYYANMTGMEDVKRDATDGNNNLLHLYLANHYIKIGKKIIFCVQV